MATAYHRQVLTGGGATALDAIDGDLLSDGDFCFVFDGTDFYCYRLNATSGAAESSPNVIAPDTNPGNKRWILQTVQGVASGAITPPSGEELAANLFTGLDSHIDTDADHDIKFDKGSCWDSTGTALIENTTANFSKRIDAVWASGTGNGGLSPNSTLSANTLYGYFVIWTGSVFDVLVVEEGQAIATELAAIDGTWTHYKFHHFRRTDGSSNLLPWYQVGNMMYPHEASKSSVGGPYNYSSYTAIDLSGWLLDDRVAGFISGAQRAANYAYAQFSYDGTNCIGGAAGYGNDADTLLTAWQRMNSPRLIPYIDNGTNLTLMTHQGSYTTVDDLLIAAILMKR